MNFTGAKYDWHLRDYQKEDNLDSLLLNNSPVLYRPIGPTFTTFPISMTINGLCYKIQSVTDYLVMIVLLAHVFLVLAHSLYVIWKRRSSSARDSISEMIALAYKSRPSDQVLENTPGGIASFQTFGVVTTIRGESSSSGTDTEESTNDPPVSRVCLVFHEGKMIRTEDAIATASGDESVPDAKAPVSVMTWAGGPSDQRVIGDFELQPFSGESQHSLLPRRRRSRQRSQATSPDP